MKYNKNNGSKEENKKKDNIFLNILVATTLMYI